MRVHCGETPWGRGGGAAGEVDPRAEEAGCMGGGSMEAAGTEVGWVEAERGEGVRGEGVEGEAGHMTAAAGVRV